MLAVCPNPTVDRLVVLGELVPGTVDRARENHAYPAGKSVSAARGCRANGAEPRVHVLLPADGSVWYLDTLRSEGMDVTAHLVPGRVRESIIVLEDSGRVSVLNGLGAAVEPGAWAGFVAEVAGLVRPGEWVICSGSFPPGVTATDVGGFVAAITEAGGRLALDTGPAWLGSALVGPALPALISPNLAEAEALLGGRPAVEDTAVGTDARRRAQAAAAALHERGVEAVVVTAGSAGLAWVMGAAAGWLAGQPVSVRNPIGAGDAVVGGLVARLEQGRAFADAAAWGLATAAAAIEQWSPGAAAASRVQHYRGLIKG